MKAVRITFFILLACSSVVSAELILQPDDLSPGDQYRLLFTTSQRIDATSSDINVYNDFVQSVADAAPIVGSWGLEWKAIVSTATVHAADNADLRIEDHENGVPVYRVDGRFLGSNDKGFFPNISGTIDSVRIEFNMTELETVIPPDPPNEDFLGTPVWIGTSSIGTVTSPLGGSHAGAEDLVGFWREVPSISTDHELPLIAISEVITAVPEPSSLALFGLGLCGLGLRRRRPA